MGSVRCGGLQPFSERGSPTIGSRRVGGRVSLWPSRVLLDQLRRLDQISSANAWIRRASACTAALSPRSPDELAARSLGGVRAGGEELEDHSQVRQPAEENTLVKQGSALLPMAPALLPAPGASGGRLDLQKPCSAALWWVRQGCEPVTSSVSKPPGTAVLGAVLPGRLGPSMPKGNAQLTSRETLSFQPPRRCSVTITSRRLAAAMQRQVGGDASTQSCRLESLELAPTQPPLLAAAANRLFAATTTSRWIHRITGGLASAFHERVAVVALASGGRAGGVLGRGGGRRVGLALPRRSRGRALRVAGQPGLARTGLVGDGRVVARSAAQRQRP
jgi:hypothetical protein